MSLKDVALKMAYTSGDDHIVEDFYLPCFKESVRYDRAVGFFTSEILVAITEGLESFVADSGMVRLICCPRMTEEDINAIQAGYKKREDAIFETCLREIDRMPANLTNNSLNFLSWLIANQKLDIKIALPQNLSVETFGIYHEKIGIFSDAEANAVVFSGSNNETLYGVAYNYESFDVYKSWADPERCNLKIEHFNNLWNNLSQGVRIYEFQDALKKRMVEKITPQEAKYVIRKSESKIGGSSPEDFLYKLWYFQKEAISEFRKKNFAGIFSMATGTGKTKTAIGALIELQKSEKETFIVIVGPQNTILKQWECDINDLNFFGESFFADGTNASWPTALADKIIDFNNKKLHSCIVYTTYNTFSSTKFTQLASRVQDNLVLVCDEMHWAGAATFRNGLLPNYKFRLGLSATPARYMDDEGTNLITDYFGGVIYEFPLDRALKEINPSTGETFLCPYNYFPMFVALNDDELAEYQELCERIRRIYARESKSEQENEMLQRLCEKRQLVITNADAKYEAFSRLIDQLKNIKHTLVYCSPQQIDRAQDLLNEKFIKNHRFTGEESVSARKEYGGLGEREYILNNFENGNYAALVAMKCLDEGINVLQAEVGILMASTGNARQYIQRRGRLLRRAPNKKMVNIYDVLVVPYLGGVSEGQLSEDEAKIIDKELKRYEEFAESANNRLAAMNIIFEMKNKFGMYKMRKESLNDN